jgi:ATP-dependent helicase HrpB
MDRWRHDRGQKAETARQMARGWAKRARSLVKPVDDAELPAGVLLAEGFPDNLAKRRDARGEEWIAAGGRGLILDPLSPWPARSIWPWARRRARPRARASRGPSR